MQPRNVIAVYGMRKPVLDSRALVSYTVHKNCGLHNQCRVQQYTIHSLRAVKLQTMCILVARELTPTLHSARLYLDTNIYTGNEAPSSLVAHGTPVLLWPDWSHRGASVIRMPLVLYGYWMRFVWCIAITKLVQITRQYIIIHTPCFIYAPLL